MERKKSIIDDVLPLIDKAGAAVLAAHGVTKEQYASWVYRKVQREIVASVVVISTLIFSFLGIAIIQNIGEHLATASRDDVILVIWSTISVLVVVLGLTAWTMRHSVNPLVQMMLAKAMLHATDAWYMQKLSRTTWHQIAILSTHTLGEKAEKILFPTTPEIPDHVWLHSERYTPLRKVLGWTTLGCLALFFFLDNIGIGTSLFLVAFGFWLLVRSYQMYIVKSIVMFAWLFSIAHISGSPARAIAVVNIIFSVCVTVVGIFWLLTSLEI